MDAAKARALSASLPSLLPPSPLLSLAAQRIVSVHVVVGTPRRQRSFWKRRWVMWSCLVNAVVVNLLPRMGLCFAGLIGANEKQNLSNAGWRCERPPDVNVGLSKGCVLF